MFVVIKAEESGVWTDGSTLMDYWIKNVETNEVRVLRECLLFDAEVFDESDFEDCEAV